MTNGTDSTGIGLSYVDNFLQLDNLMPQTTFEALNSVRRFR